MSTHSVHTLGTKATEFMTYPWLGICLDGTILVLEECKEDAWQTQVIKWNLHESPPLFSTSVKTDGPEEGFSLEKLSIFTSLVILAGPILTAKHERCFPTFRHRISSTQTPCTTIESGNMEHLLIRESVSEDASLRGDHTSNCAFRVHQPTHH